MMRKTTKMEELQKETKKNEAQQNPETDRRTLVNIDAVTMAWVTMVFPIVGFISCIALSIIYDFEKSTATHCRVANYLPSTSAAIGGFTPQRYIWRICIGLDCGPRIIMAVGCYYHDYISCDLFGRSTVYSTLVKVNAALHLVENCCLVLLTMISSSENYHYHEMSFIGFLVSSEFYMVCTLVLFRQSRDSRGWSLTDIKSYKLKKIFFTINITTCLLSAYVFVRHNTYCEPGVYTVFVLGEYIIIISNFFFHATDTLDFHRQSIVMTDPMSSGDRERFVMYTVFAACEYTVILTNILFHSTALYDFRRGRLLLTETPGIGALSSVPSKLK